MDISSVSFIGWIIYSILGRLLMFLWLKQPLSGWIGKRVNVLGQLFSCGLCLGVWTYWILAFFLKIRLIDNIPVVGEFLLGCVTSFIVWVFEAGWNTLFRNFILGASDD